MNTINPQSTPSGVPRSEAPGGERTESRSTEQSGNGLPQVEARDVSDKPQSDQKDQLANAVAILNNYQTVRRDYLSL